MSYLKSWTGAWIIGLSMVFFLETGVCGTYIYYNEDGEVVRYLPKPKQKAIKAKAKAKKITPKPHGNPPGEKPYKPKYKLEKKE